MLFSWLVTLFLPFLVLFSWILTWAGFCSGGFSTNLQAKFVPSTVWQQDPAHTLAIAVEICRFSCGQLLFSLVTSSWIVISKAGILFSSPLGLPREVLDKCLLYQLNHASSAVINCFPRLTGLSLRLLYLSSSDSFHKYLAQSTYSSVENGKLFYLLCKTSRNRGKSPGSSYEKQDEIISARRDILQGCSHVEGRCLQDSPGRGQRLCWGSGHLSRREQYCRRQAGTVLGSTVSSLESLFCVMDTLAGPCVYWLWSLL